jgi:hypothetical protein
MIIVSILEIKNPSNVRETLRVSGVSFEYNSRTDILYREGFIIPSFPNSLPITVTLPSGSSATISEADRWIVLFASDAARIDVHMQVMEMSGDLPEISRPPSLQGASPAQLYTAITQAGTESVICATAIVATTSTKQVTALFARLVREFTQRVRTKETAALVFPAAPCNVLMRSWLRLYVTPELKDLLSPIFAEASSLSVKNVELFLLILGKLVTALAELVTKHVPPEFAKALQEGLQRSHERVDVVMTAGYMLSLAALQTAIAYSLPTDRTMGAQLFLLQAVSAFFEPSESEVGRLVRGESLQGDFKAGIRKIFASGQKSYTSSKAPVVSPGQKNYGLLCLSKFATDVNHPELEHVEKPEFVKLVGEFVKNVTAKRMHCDSQHYFHFYHLHQIHNSVHFNNSSVAIYGNNQI